LRTSGVSQQLIEDQVIGMPSVIGCYGIFFTDQLQRIMYGHRGKPIGNMQVDSSGVYVYYVLRTLRTCITYFPFYNNLTLLSLIYGLTLLWL